MRKLTDSFLFLDRICCFSNETKPTDSHGKGPVIQEIDNEQGKPKEENGLDKVQ